MRFVCLLWWPLNSSAKLTAGLWRQSVWTSGLEVQWLSSVGFLVRTSGASWSPWSPWNRPWSRRVGCVCVWHHSRHLDNHPTVESTFFFLLLSGWIRCLNNYTCQTTHLSNDPNICFCRCYMSCRKWKYSQQRLSALGRIPPFLLRLHLPACVDTPPVPG